MTAQDLFKQIIAKRSFLCVGLDTDYSKIPAHIISRNKHLENGEDTVKSIFDFNVEIIEATAPYTVCYKPNLAFYEAYSSAGIQALELTCRYIKKKYPDIFLIADAKRGDIGNTSELYARAFIGGDAFFDAVTLSPYMGRDSVDPFLSRDGKWAVILALTSNSSAIDFELQKLENGKYLYEQVLETSAKWGTIDNTMYVVGATKADTLDTIRQIVPDHFLLVPGVGAQGGSLHDVAAYGMNKQCGLLVNSSRGIIYADSSEYFAETASKKAREIQQEMDKLLTQYL